MPEDQRRFQTQCPATLGREQLRSLLRTGVAAKKVENASRSAHGLTLFAIGNLASLKDSCEDVTFPWPEKQLRSKQVGLKYGKTPGCGS